MRGTATEEPTCAVVLRLQQAINAHDLEAVVCCFALDYRNETPVRPARSFDAAVAAQFGAR